MNENMNKNYEMRMKLSDLKIEIVTSLILILLIVLSRLSNHLWNFTVVGGAALFAGAFFKNRALPGFLAQYFAVGTIFLGLILSDLFLGFHSQIYSVYFSYALICGLGMLLSGKNSRPLTWLYSLTGALLFFLITNFAVWYNAFMYPLTWHGLMQSYQMGLPFFRHQLISDLISTTILFEVAKQLKILNGVELPGAETKTF